MESNIHNNLQVLQQIEWESIKKLLSTFNYFDSTIEEILRDISKEERINIFEFTQSFYNSLQGEFFRSLQQEFNFLPRNLNFDLLINSISKQQALKLSSLNHVANSIEIIWDNISSFQELKLIELTKEDLNKAKQLINQKFLKTFRKFVARDGEINFENHPDLRPLFLAKTEIELKIRKNINYLLNDNEFSQNLQFDSYDIINERFVVPIKSDHYQSSMGQIVTRSDTGHTLFVETTSIGKDNRKRIEYILEIEKILAKIELDITVKLSEFLFDINLYFDVLKKFDIYATRAQFAFEKGLCKPSLSTIPVIDLKDFFHPLIPNPIKNDFYLGPESKGFIISGPNTGGKTATLKTMCLIQFFLKFGLFIPAREANVYLYDSIFYFGDDGQNLEEGLSSFAAEVKNYTHLFGALTESNFIVIDEIFNTTSSEEASALALSIFKQLEIFPNTQILVSTHHQTLKTLLHNENHYISAHVGFNIEENAPTYKLNIGSPGSSFALNIFKNMISEELNLSDILQNAYKFLDNKTIHYEKLLTRISQKENELNKVLEENKSLNLILKNKNSAMEGVLKLKLDEKINQAQKTIDSYMSKAKQALDDSKSKKISKPKSIDNIHFELKKKLKDLSPFNEEYTPEIHTNLSLPDAYIEGDNYFSTLLKTTVTLKRLNLKKGEALVTSGNLTLKTPLDKLMLANKKNTQSLKASVSPIEVQSDAKMEYDCRGMRLDEFENIVEKAVSSLLLGLVPYINIIHGHGTGVLKNWIRKYIKNNPEIQQDSDDSGNDGSTRIILK